MDIKNDLLVERLRVEMERKGLNARELAERAEVGRSFIYDILSGRSKNPTTRKLSAIAEILGVDLTHLTSEHVDSYPFLQDEGNGVVAVPSVSVEASMGPGSLVIEELPGRPFYFHPSFIQGLSGNEDDLRVIGVRGNSMQPTLEEKDNVLIDLSQTSPTPPGIFALHDGMGLMIKRLQYINDPDMPKVRVISDNEQYKTVELPLSELHIIGRVVWLCREL